MTTLAIGSGEWILVLVVVLMLLGVAVGLFTGAGSEISSHPRGRHRAGGSGGSAPPGDGELPGDEGRRFPSTRGTR
jgi:hypothetical protein